MGTVAEIASAGKRLRECSSPGLHSNLLSVAAPDFVPTDPSQRTRIYTSPPLRPGGWTAGRPGEIDGSQPKGAALGTTGPDQGYAYRLVRHLEDRLHLADTERDDAVAGGVALAMKRSALAGRAPVIHDLTAAFTIFGFLDADPPRDLIEWRRSAFAEISSHHHYLERRELIDLVPEELLTRPHGEIEQLYRADWRQFLAGNRAADSTGDEHS